MNKIENLNVSEYISTLAKKSKNKILVVGNYNGENVGDNAILKVILHDLEDINDSEIYVPTRFIEKTDKIISNIYQNKVKAIQVNPFNITFIKKFISANICIIGGGTIFSKYLGFFVYLVPVFCIIGKILGKKVVFYSIGYEKSTPQLVTLMMKVAFKFVDKISVRDYKSLNNLRALGINNNVDLIADPVFRILDYFTEKEKNLVKKELEVLESKYNLENSIIGVFNYLKEDDKSRNLINLASSEINKELLVNPNSNILLISFYISDVHQKDDTDIHNEISLLINKPVQIVSEIISPFTVIELMKSSQKVYSQRLHSMILAYVSGVNFVAIPYQDKCIELLEQMGHKNILDFKY